MNGRVFDPVLGRFLSADPFVDDAGDSQSYNRYSYVNNNPLNYTDPSGYFKLSLKMVATIVAVVVISIVTYGAASGLAAGWVAGAGLTGTTASIATGAIAGAISGFASGFAGSLLNGGGIGDAFKSGVIGAGIGAVMGGVMGGIAGPSDPTGDYIRSLPKYASTDEGFCFTHSFYTSARASSAWSSYFKEVGSYFGHYMKGVLTAPYAIAQTAASGYREMWDLSGQMGTSQFWGDMGRMVVHPIDTLSSTGGVAADMGQQLLALPEDPEAFGTAVASVAIGGYRPSALSVDLAKSSRVVDVSRYGRVKPTKGLRSEVWERSKASNGKVYDPSGVEIKPGEPWEMGHRPGYKFSDAQRRAAEQGWDSSTWKASQRDPDIYRPERPRTNAGHRYESD